MRDKTMSDNKITLKELLLRHNKVIIPDIQRDYVLGSGKSKLEHLFENMEKANGSFEFSCVLAHKDEDNNVFIYDGQQRLATLVYLCAKIAYENKDAEVQNLLQRFEFKGRDLANQWIAKPDQIAKEQAVDFTTYSAAELIETFEKKMQSPQYASKEKLTLDFFFEKVKFNLLFIKEVSDSEQFFMDVNDGLDLKDYEIYKAELYHHAKRILGEEFKEFALKMENEWLEFFLKYKEERVYEEEVLVQFLKYCFRMMWIEDSKNIEEYRGNDISWIEERHLRKIENIVDGIIEYFDKNAKECGSDLSCVNYYHININKMREEIKIEEQGKHWMGEHWNIIDNNYVEVLKIFIRYLGNKETNKDAMIWCFLSNIHCCLINMQNISKLYDYMRFIKKILNNNRNENSIAKINYFRGNPLYNVLYFALYYVKDIPGYYIRAMQDINSYYLEERSNNGDHDSNYLQTVIICNRDIDITVDTDYVIKFLKKCHNEKLERILKKQILKNNSKDRTVIEEYENLPFINGLVDGFVQYDDNECYLKEWTNEYSPRQLSDICTGNDYSQYRSILNFITQNNINYENYILKGIEIRWRNYNGTEYGVKRDILVHTWCDFFTNDYELIFGNEQIEENNYILDLPDGWLAGKELYQPEITDVNNKNGFAGYGLETKLFNLSCFEQNFSSISKNEQGGYLINKKSVESLPDFLENYNGNAWVDKWLSITDRIYYPCAKYDGYEDYLNKVLLGKYKRFLGYSEEEFEKYLFELKKEDEDMVIMYREIEGVHYFILAKSCL